jgi:3-dehydroquinate dehydratase-1
MTNPAVAQIVGVICSRADLRRALQMRNPPDLFELRLDAAALRIEEIENAIGKLRAPLIVTARHPREGGFHQLSSRKRRDLLRRFLPRAACVDIELRAARPLAVILREACAKKIRAIISVHDLADTPGPARLDDLAHAAHSLGADVFKIAARTDTPRQLTRLLDFFERRRAEMKIAAMGMGRLGRSSRLELARRGSALNYAHLGRPQTPGQLSIAELRRALR